MSVGLLKALTAGVIAFVIGQSNGTGRPQFTQDLQGTLQRVGDVKAQAFFIQFGRNSNSPFASSISSSLKTSYLQQTSMAGFWAKYRSTLALASPNVNAFLAGNWSQGGGTRAWMALTTQPENNPYLLHQAAESQLSSVVADAQATRDKVLAWGQGFMSWCGSYDASASSGATGVNPGDDCTDADGNPGTMKTPGGTIKSTLDKVLGSTQDVLTKMGSVGPEVNKIMGDLAQVFQTINLAQTVLGGPGSGGLAGFGSVSSNGSSAFVAYNRSNLFGVTQATVNQNAAVVQSNLVQPFSQQVNEYDNAWSTIRAETGSVASALTSFKESCTQYAPLADQALQTEIAPLTARGQAAAQVVADARAFIVKIQGEQNQSGATSTTTPYLADLQKLQSMSPTAQETSAAQQESIAGSGSVASSTNSLIVSGGSIIDQLALIKQNLSTLTFACQGPISGAGG
jgi:hypothetical protein